MNYRSYLSQLYFSSDLKKLSNTDLYGTSYNLFTEFQSEATTAKLYARRMLGFDAQSEIEFYMLMDYLTLIPFGSLGRKWLSEQKIDASTLKYDKSMLILEKAEIRLSEEERHRLKLFFDTYSDDVQPITPVGYANITRKISDRLLNMILIQECAGSIEKSKRLAQHLKEMVQELGDSEATQFDVGAILSRLPDMQSPDEVQTKFLEVTVDAFR